MNILKYIQDLNEFGLLSSAYLARKYKMNGEHARRTLFSIVEDYENVRFRTPDQIYIEGRELKEWEPKVKQKKIREKRVKTSKMKTPSKWKDITKN